MCRFTLPRESPPGDSLGRQGSVALPWNEAGAMLIRAADTRRWRRLLIALGLLLALLQLFRASHGARTRFITNDGDWYYAYLASMYFDRDLDLSNQMAVSQKLAGRPALAIPGGRPTPTPYTVGPALLWMPAFALADAAVLAARSLGEPVSRDGYSMPYQIAVAWATLLYGLFGVWLASKAMEWWLGDDIKRWRKGPALAVAAALLATPALYYLFFEPTMAHGLSIFAASLLVWSCLRVGGSAKWIRWFGIGAAGGLCALIRPQDCLLLLLPASTIAALGARGMLARGSGLVAGAALVFSPLALAWQATFGRPFAVPQGPEFLQWAKPALLQVWFSPHHGLFAWTPVWIAGVVGLALVPSQMRRLAIAALVVFLLESYVNAAARDWWAGDSFGARRFLSLFPIFALGMSMVTCRVEKRWQPLCVGVAAAAIAANLLLMAAYVTGRVPHG